MVDVDKDQHGSLKEELRAYFKASVAGLKPGQESLARDMDIARVDIELTARLTDSVRRFLGSDSILMVAYDTEKYAALHHHQLGLTAASWAGYAAAGEWSGAAMEVRCTKSAELMLRILEDPDLAGLRKGMTLMLQHEIGHLKLSEHAASMGYGTPDSEGMAHLYGLGRVENGRRDSAIDAMAQMIAVGYYLFPSGSVEEHTYEVFTHWRDSDADSIGAILRTVDGKEDVGMNRFKYLEGDAAERDVAARVPKWLALMEGVIGKMDTDWDAMWTHVENGS